MHAGQASRSRFCPMWKNDDNMVCDPDLKLLSSRSIGRVAGETTIAYGQSEGERGADPRGMLRPRRISLRTTASL